MMMHIYMPAGGQSKISAVCPPPPPLGVDVDGFRRYVCGRPGWVAVRKWKKYISHYIIPVRVVR
jgi:hypothetical protein